MYLYIEIQDITHIFQSITHPITLRRLHKHSHCIPLFPQADIKKGRTAEKTMKLVFYCVPTTPGHSKLFFAFPNNFLPEFLKLIPVWFRHIGQLTILDSDMYFLHMQVSRQLKNQPTLQIRYMMIGPSIHRSKPEPKPQAELETTTRN